MNLVGIDIGGTKIALCVLESTGVVHEFARFRTGPPEAALERIFRALDPMAARGETVYGIACGGPMDAPGGRILSPPNLPGWDDVPIVDLLERRLGGRAFLMNDANANALAEWRYGAGRGTRSMIFLTAGTGMGAGLILDGRLYEGTSGDAGEVGHMRLAAAGPVGYGKAGSFEGFCSGGAIPQLVRFLPRADKPPDVASWLRRHPTTRDVGAAARRGDRVARRVLAEAGRRLGEALAVLLDVLNPECVVLGTVYRANRAFLTPAMEAVLERETLPAARRACRILPAELGRQLGNYGALCAAAYRLGSLEGLSLPTPPAGGPALPPG